MRGGVATRRGSDPDSARQELAERPRQRVLLLPDGRIVGGGGGCGVVHVALAVSDLFHGRLRRRVGGRRGLVWARGAGAYQRFMIGGCGPSLTVKRPAHVTDAARMQAQHRRVLFPRRWRNQDQTQPTLAPIIINRFSVNRRRSCAARTRESLSPIAKTAPFS